MALQARVPLVGDNNAVVVVTTRVPIDLARKQAEIHRHIKEYDQHTANRKATRATYLLLLALITLFILFVATWLALFVARLVIIPISALLAASLEEVRQGQSGHRVTVQATDELASLVQAFNEMTQALETNARELESRRRFIEVILENIPGGVVSIASDGRIRTTNQALSQIFPPDKRITIRN